MEKKGSGSQVPWEAYEKEPWMKKIARKLMITLYLFMSRLNLHQDIQ